MNSEDDQFRTARTQARAEVKRHVETLRDRGCSPNRRVQLGEAVFDAWLIADPHHHALCQRWLLLDDGDVFCETLFGAETSDQPGRGVYGWIDSCDESLLGSLRQSLADLDDGGRGFLCGPSGERPFFFVPDRRSRPRD